MRDAARRLVDVIDIVFLRFEIDRIIRSRTRPRRQRFRDPIRPPERPPIMLQERDSRKIRPRSCSNADIVNAHASGDAVTVFIRSHSQLETDSITKFTTTPTLH